MNYTPKELDAIIARHRSEDRGAALTGIGAALLFGFVCGWAGQSIARIAGLI